jgi:hypothetical protein
MQGQRSSLARGLAAMVAVSWFVLALPPGAQAIRIDLGDLRGYFDTTISVGTSYRVGARDPSIIGVANGGEAWSINGDNGNLNFDAGGFFSNVVKLTHELQLSWGRWSAFSRAFYFYDAQLMDWAEPRTRLSAEARNELGRDFTLLDAYVAGDFSLGNSPLTVKVGNQVLNWGESVFIQNGLNSMNTVDASKLRIAGSELRDAFEAIPMAQASIDLSDRFTLEGFVPFRWNNTEIEPEGTLFSTNDFASPGGRRVLLGFGVPGISDTELNPGVGAPVGVDVFRARDVEARDGGEWGVALRWFEPKLNDTELAFYWTRLHSRLPLISGWTGLLQEGFGQGNYAATANYFREFPEDIDKFGISWNTEIGQLPLILPSGAAFQGEVSYTHDQPLQVDDVELLLAALSPLDQFIGFDSPDRGFKLSQLAGGTSFGFDEYISGYRRKDVIQAQFATTQLFGPRLGADQWVLLTETGGMYVKDMEDKSELRYEGPGTYTSANPWFTNNISPASGNPLQPFTEVDGFADQFSWGYRVVLRGEFNNLVSAINVQPTVVWYHDVNGTSPTPVLNFIDDRKQVSAILAADYLISWTAKLAYTNSFGGDRYNLLKDRDFWSFSLGYSF